jgi:hypothetical protein
MPVHANDGRLTIAGLLHDAGSKISQGLDAPGHDHRQLAHFQLEACAA